MTQAVVYQNDLGVFPGTVGNLRATGYGNIQDRDSWGRLRVTTALFGDTTPALTDSNSNEDHVSSP